MDKLAIITVLYNNYSILKDFLNSLYQQNDNRFHLFIIDLSDNKKKFESPLFSTVINDHNHGYAYGVNLGLKKAIEKNYKMFCIVNNDTYFKNNFVSRSISSLIRNPSSLIGGKIYYAPGFEYHKDRYKNSDLGKVIWYAGGQVDWNHALTIHKLVDKIDNDKQNKLEKTDFITGCLMCFDLAVVNKIGFWDESYFLYYEDADYCERAKRQRIKLYYDPLIVIWHKNAQSTDGSGSKTHQKYQDKNRLRFALKYAPVKTKLHLLKNTILNLFKIK